MQNLSEILTPERTVCRAPGLSQKRIFETAASIISEDLGSLSSDLVFSSLIAREKLGSTGLGNGIAIPHCRVSDCAQATGMLMTLETPIDFDAPDGNPVDILFILLVPEEAQQQHLDILAGIAGLFSQARFCKHLRAATSAKALYDAASNWSS